MDNILMTQPAGQGRVGLKIADLGSCISVTGTDTTRVSFEMQTLPYRAPEVVLAMPCGPAIDIWSLGCILTELALGKPLFP
eukprot:jgi/Astpho2/3415/gw1.00055.85.1_t